MILVTGASGFVGTHLCKHLVEEKEKVVALIHDRLVWNPWQIESLSDCVLVEGDIRNLQFLKRVLNQYDISCVYHLAAQSIVKKAWKDPVNTFDINVMGTVKLLEACHQLDIGKIVVQSTDKVYGSQMLASNSAQLCPTEPYGTSKISADVTAQTFANTYGMNVTVLRPCNIFGYDWNNRIVPNTVKACLRGQSPIIFKDESSKRQYIHIDNVTEVLASLNKAKTGIYNLGNPNDILSQVEVVFHILEFFPGIKPQYVKKPQLKEIHSQSLVTDFDISYIQFREGIRRTIEAFKRFGF